MENPFIPRVSLEKIKEISNYNEIEEREFLNKNGMFAMLTFYPKLTNYKINSEIIILLDRSGSMSGSFIKKAKKSLKRMLQILPKSCYFQIVSFGTNHSIMFQKSVKATTSNISKATSKIDEMEANMGGTDIYTPLQYILEEPIINGYSRNIIGKNFHHSFCF